jgi:rhodanese-related sulfurtransferase
LKVGSKLFKRYVNIALMALIALSALASFEVNAQVALLFGDLSWGRINSYLDKEYPDVANISTQELAKLTGVVLLDTRTVDEYKASHLPNAERFDESNSAVLRDLFAKLSKNTPIVVYCSVGVRSAAVARRLTAQGYTQVKNLRGSAFMWANEGRLLEGQSAPKVHPFNSRWGALLAPELRLPI